MTLLQMVNKLLIRLREDEVDSTNSSDYSVLMVAFINEGLSMVQDAFMWKSQDTVVEIALTDGTRDYTAVGTTYPSMLRMVDGNAQVFLEESNGQEVPLKLVPEHVLERLYRQDTTKTGKPTHFSLVPEATADAWTLRFHPIPDGTYTVNAKFWVPQEELAADGTDDATSILPPNLPVYSYALMMAANERGEEMGEPGNLLERKFINDLGAAVEVAVKADEAGNIYEFRRD